MYYITSYSEPRCIVICSTYEINGRHATSNFPIDPFIVYLIFSILRKNMTSQIHLPKEGGWSLFQFKRMSRRAKREEWAILFNCGFCRGRSSAGTPKSIMKGQGSIVSPEVAEEY